MKKTIYGRECGHVSDDMICGICNARKYTMIDSLIIMGT